MTQRPELVDRFELFVHGRELCNAFSELNDPDDQAARFRDQVEKKAKAAPKRRWTTTRTTSARSSTACPPRPASAWAIDRLAMMLTGAPSIRDVILFPLLRTGAAECSPKAQSEIVVAVIA